MRPFALIVLLSLIACPITPPAPAAPVLPEVVQLAPDTAPFRITSHRRVEHTVRDRPIVSTGSRQAWLTIRMAPGGGGVTALWVLDSVTSAAPSGDLIDEDDGADPGWHSLLPPALPGGARPGASWTDTTSHESRMEGVTATWSTVSRRHVSGWTTWGGAAALEVVSRGDYTVSGDGTHAGQPVALSGTGRRHTRHYLSPSGRFLAGTAADSATLEVRLATNGLAIPVQHWSADTVEARR